MGTMYLGLKNSALVNTIAEIDLTHTLDEVMELEFPIYADLFRGELRPLLTGGNGSTSTRSTKTTEGDGRMGAPPNSAVT